MPGPKPDIQRLLRRHLHGTAPEKREIEEAMAGVLVTHDLAKEAATRGLACVKAGRLKQARAAQAEADRWFKKLQMYQATLASQRNIPKR